MAGCTVGIIGAGGHCPVVLEQLERLPGARVTAISPGGDSDQAVAEWCQRHGQTPRRFENYLDLLDEVKPEVVVVAGPFDRHAEMSVAAIQRGIHVLCEKPVALTWVELDRIRQACAAHPDVLLAGMMFSRFGPYD